MKLKELKKKWKGCDDKRVFITEKSAKDRTKYIWKNKKERLYVYSCVHCGFYHLTSKKQ